VTVSASSATRTLGGCTVATPGELDVTCRVALHGPAPAAMTVKVTLAAGRHVLSARTASGSIPIMRMLSGLPLGATTKASPLDFLCSPGGVVKVTG
jgi:hypothetical protein